MVPNVISYNAAILSHSFASFHPTEKFSARLEDADESSVIGGWEKNNTRERVEKFLANGLESVVAPSENLPRVLVHGDFSKSDPSYLRHIC